MAEKAAGEPSAFAAPSIPANPRTKGSSRNSIRSTPNERLARPSSRASAMKAGMALPRIMTMAGYSGGTMDRPALQRLLGDIGAGKVDVVVVYKIDRLTRSLFDFAKIVEAFDAKGVSFVSVTQQFNTTTSMGRLTLNVLLSFAQFEREVTSERIRDKIAASKQKGMWMGGAVPLGYDGVNRKLRINAEEAKTIRQLFELYLKLGSVRQLQAECERRRLRTKLRTMLDGRRSGGTAFSRGHLYRILSNPIYIGRFRTGTAATKESIRPSLTLRPGRRFSLSSQRTPAAKKAEPVPSTPACSPASCSRRRASPSRPPMPSIIAGAIATMSSDRCWRPALPTESQTRNRVDGTGNGFETKGWRLPAHQIEHLVLKQLTAFLRDRGALLDALRCKHKSPHIVFASLARASELVDSCDAESFANQAEMVVSLVRRITVAQDQVTIEVSRQGLAVRLMDQEAFSKSETPSKLGGKNHPPILIKVPVRFRRRGVEAKLVVSEQLQPASEPDAKLVKALARAHEWFGKILRGEANGTGDIAHAEGLCRTYVTRVLCLAFLAPETTRAILQGRQPTELTVKRLVSSALKIPLRWPEQITFISSANPRA